MLQLPDHSGPNCKENHGKLSLRVGTSTLQTLLLWQKNRKAPKERWANWWDYNPWQVSSSTALAVAALWLTAHFRAGIFTTKSDYGMWWWPPLPAYCWDQTTPAGVLAPVWREDLNGDVGIGRDRITTR